MANTERARNGEAGLRSGTESPKRGAIATCEDIQAERICGQERGLSAAYFAAVANLLMRITTIKAKRPGLCFCFSMLVLG